VRPHEAKHRKLNSKPGIEARNQRLGKNKSPLVLAPAVNIGCTIEFFNRIGQ
jgi:hypothetical protein